MYVRHFYAAALFQEPLSVFIDLLLNFGKHNTISIEEVVAFFK